MYYLVYGLTHLVLLDINLILKDALPRNWLIHQLWVLEVKQIFWSLGLISSKKIQKGSVETKSPSMFLGDHHFRNLFFKNLNFCKMSLDEFHGQIFSLQHLRQRISEFIYLSKLKIFENLVKNEDFWKFGQNWRFFKFW